MIDSFGSWSTAVNSGAPWNSTLLEMEPAMLPRRIESRAERPALLVLIAVAIVSLASPTLKSVPHMQSVGTAGAFADDAAKPGDGGKTAAAADRPQLPAAAVTGQEAAVDAEYLPLPTRFEAQVAFALEEPVEVNFLDLPLNDCLDYLAHTTKIPMQLDTQTLTDEGVPLNAPITLKLKECRLKSVLHLLLEPMQLAFLYEDDLMVVTTATRAGEKLFTRTYPVRDLFHGRLGADVRTQAPNNAAGNAKGGGFFGIDIQVAQGFGGGLAGRGIAGGHVADPDGRAFGAPEPPRWDDLVDAIITTIEPDSWANLSGPGTLVYVKETGCLVIKQTRSAHDQILQLLRDLRKSKILAKAASRLHSVGTAAAIADDNAQPTDAVQGAARGDRRGKADTEAKSRDIRAGIEYLPHPSLFEERLLAALEQPVKVEFVDLPLEDCLQHLEEAAAISMWLDKQTLTDEGVALDQPVTLKLKDRRLESVLHLLLDPVQLTFLSKHDVMVITTQAKAGENLITRTYPVRDLYQGPVHSGVALPHAPNDKQAGGTEVLPAKGIEAAGDAAQEADKAAKTKPLERVPTAPRADLVAAITNTIEPDSWESLSGPGSCIYVKEAGCLVIRQTWAVHRQILQLLRDLRIAKNLAPGGSAPGNQ
jgi:hypothetical protein